ncbi:MULTISPECIES: hypothetical protein [unclassified Carboxylicivirga]|uniref:hypothetical protein n=1 Tax=Carboxylicivirga TaxID=1628153 RepID=UPI003D350C92
MTDSIVKNKLHKPIESLTINKEDLLKFLNLLQERANAACDIECKHIENTIDADKLEKSKEDLKGCSQLKVTVNGIDGEQLFGSIDDVFNSVSFPEQIKSLYLNSELIYESRFNYIPRNRFEVFIDFTKPKVLDFSFLPSEKTPNDSNFTVEGFDNTWVNGVFSEIDKYFEKRSSKFSSIHQNSVYDIIVWTLGLPIGFWACSKIEDWINQSFTNDFLSSLSYVYIFFISLMVLRVLFHYSRWLYPKLQFKSNQDLSLIHRGFFYVITTGILGSFLYDIIKYIF